MSLRAISETLLSQNMLIVEMSDNAQSNSESLQSSVNELNEIVSTIKKVLVDQEKEEQTEESRRRLTSQDEEESRQGRSLFSGFLGSDNKEKGKGLLGGIFSKALGFLVKSLPLIGLAGLFFGDVVTGVLTAAIGDYGKAELLKNVLGGALLGTVFGFRGALIGAIIGAIFSDETQTMLKSELGKISGAFDQGLLEGISSLGPLAAGLGALAIALAPFRFLGAAFGVLKGSVNLIGGLLGFKGIGAKAVDGVKTPTRMASVGSKIGGLAKAGTIGLGTALTSGVVKRGVGGAIAKGKDVAETLAIKSMYAKDAITSAVRPAPSLAGGASSGSALTGSSTSVGKISSRVALKKIPIIGALAGLGFGASRLIGGDVSGAGMEVLSGLASVVPGVGTAASLGIDAALIAKDAGVFDKKAQEIEASRKTKGQVLSEATRERDELVTKTSSNVIMDNSTTNNVSSGGGGAVMTSPISWNDGLDPYNKNRV